MTGSSTPGAASSVEVGLKAEIARVRELLLRGLVLLENDDSELPAALTRRVRGGKRDGALIQHELEQHIRAEERERFAGVLTDALADRDARLVELDAHATDRLRLLEESTARADRLERECADLTRQLQAAAQRADSLEHECSQLRQLAIESSARSDDFDRQSLPLQNEPRDGVDQSDADVVRSADSIVLIGSSWHDVEIAENEPFRWVANEAQLNLGEIARSPCTLILNVEPGPDVGGKPFELTAYEGGARIASAIVVGRGQVELSIPASSTPRVREIALRCEKTAAAAPAFSGDYAKAYRVFSIRLKRLPADVVPTGFELGEGWYALQTSGDQTFRWADAEAIVEAGERADDGTLALDVEPAGGLGAFTLKVSVGSQQALSFGVDARRRIEIPLSAGAATIKLQAESSDERVLGDSRTFCFRAFAVRG